MVFTWSASTAYCSTDSTFRSAGSARLATLRCTKISPACAPVSSSAGTRLSEQPMNRKVGCWLSAFRAK
jgi:hypothetical protein